MIDQAAHEVTDEQLDRLVDGELSADEYCRVVASLDDVNDGWRRCALSFLEAQALGKEISRASSEGATLMNPVETNSQTKTRFDWRVVLTMAASFLIAFSLGLAWNGGFHTGESHPPSIAEVLSEQTNEEANGNDRAVASAEQVEDEYRPHGLPDPDRNLTLVVDDGMSITREVNLPVYRFDEDLVDLLEPPPAAIPVDVADALRRVGHDIYREHRLMPLRLEDGSDVVVPVEEVRIVPVRQLYQ